MSSSRSWSSSSRRKSRGTSPRRRSLRSPKISPPSSTQTSGLIEITIKSVMEGVHGANVLVPTSCDVFELKTIVAGAVDVPPEKQLLLYNNKELKQRSPSVSMLFLPLVVQQGSISNLRNTIKSMTSVAGRPGHRRKNGRSKEFTTTCSPAKQMENELIRSRMKRLMRNRKSRKALSDTSSSAKSTSSSISPEKNPLHITSDSHTSIPQSNDEEITEKQLQVFFDPPESVEEMMIANSAMVMPPANMEELMKIKAKRKESSRKICMFCYRKVSLAEQHIQCLCKQIFCRKHRQPSAHYCSVDYKQKGKSKISKENPRILEGGYHKAHQE